MSSAALNAVGQPIRAAAAALAGTTIEWYDFFIYSTASALVFPQLFFPNSDPNVALLISLATFGVGFFARPFGGFFFGHLGDRLGRKRALIATLLMMGLSTAAIGVLPGYAQIGIWAPVTLIALRIFQGISVGGEWGGAVLMAGDMCRRAAAPGTPPSRSSAAPPRCCSRWVFSRSSHAYRATASRSGDGEFHFC